MKTINDYAELVKEKHALNKTIAPVETDLTDASREYHIGEQFIIDGGLFKAKTEIAQHDELVLNTNYEPADNLTEQIKNAGGGTGTDPRLDVFENNIAPVETDETDASKEYQVGEQLILNNILYDVIAPISEHDVITTTGSGANIAPADPISSQFEALTNKLNNEIVTRSALGAKNILPFDLAEIKALNTNGTWAGNVYTYRGVAFTVNADGTISATGTATGGNASLKIFAASSNYEMLGKEVILTGCPSGGGASTYRIQAYRMATADGSTGTYFDDGAGTDAFTALNDASETVGSFAVAVYENETVTNLLFKPMVRLASDPDATYQPYAKTNRELTAENEVLKNDTYNVNNTAITEVASDDLLPIYDTSATDKKKIAVSSFIGGLVSNPNLLDNPWFTVNQRGQSSYSGAVYSVDRWRSWENNDLVTVNANGIGSTKQIGQVLDDISRIIGKVVTISCLLTDGTMLKATGLIQPTATDAVLLGNEIPNLFNIILYGNTSNISFQVNNVGSEIGTELDIRAVKLELGEVSTLAMDTAPNYQQELAKCQRYFVRFNSPGAGSNLSVGYQHLTNQILVIQTMPVSMRAKPTITVTALRSAVEDTTYAIPIDTIVAANMMQNILKITITTSSNLTTPAGSVHWVYLSANEYMDFSADL